MEMKKKAVLFWACAFTGLATLYFLRSQKLAGDCVREELSSATSFDGLHISVVSRVGCGVTTPNSTVVSLKFLESGEPEQRDIFSIKNSPSKLTVRWRSNRILEVTCGGCDENDVWDRTDKVRGIGIVFESTKGNEGQKN